MTSLPVQAVAPADVDPVDAARRRHRVMLTLCGIAVVLAFALTIRPDGRVAFRFLETLAVPDTCLSQWTSKLACPGCGLTRSILCLVRGDLAGSLAYHAMGWVLAAVIVTQIPYRMVCLRRGAFPGVAPWMERGFAVGLIAALVLHWLLNQR
jgi:hypothetical protein